MDPLTRWEAAAITGGGRRPRPGTGRGPALDLRDPRPSEPPPAAPPESLLVPLDAWNRMLAQLGNLHEAGRELAEARERAAKAETEVDFLRERLADLRSRLDAVDPATAAPPVAPDTTSAASQPDGIAVTRPLELVRSYYAGWRTRRRGS